MYKTKKEPQIQDALQEFYSSQDEEDEKKKSQQSKYPTLNVQDNISNEQQQLMISQVQRSNAKYISEKYTKNQAKSPSKLKKAQPIQEQSQQNVEEQQNQRLIQIKQSSVQFQEQEQEDQYNRNELQSDTLISKIEGLRDSSQSFSDIRFSQLNDNHHTANNSPINFRVSNDSSNPRESTNSFSDFQSQQFDVNSFSEQKKKQEYKYNIKRVEKHQNAQKQYIPKDMFTTKMDQLTTQKSGDSTDSNPKQKNRMTRDMHKKQNQIFLGQSLYMQPVQPHKPPKFDLSKQIKANSESVQLFEVAGDYIFRTNKAERKVNIKLFRQLQKQFLNSKSKIMIPLIDEKALHSKYLYQFLSIFLAFMNKKYKQIFFNLINEVKINDQVQSEKQEGYLSFLNFNFMKKQKNWKAAKIKNLLQSKLEVFSSMQTYNSPNISVEIRTISQTLAKFDFLLAFQRSQQYCQQKLNNVNSIQQPIWKDFRNQIINDRNWWVTHQFSEINI